MYLADFPGDRDMAEMYISPPREYLFTPTDSGLTIVNLVLSKDIVDDFRQNVRENFYRSFDQEGELGVRLRAARSEGRIRGVLDQPNFYRRSHGPGWALVGDATYCKDPIRAQGITDAFLDAEGLAAVLDNGLSGASDMTAGLRDYEQARQERTAFPYDICLRAARFALPPPEETYAFLKVIENNPAAIAEFRGLICGSVRRDSFYNPQHMSELIGAGAFGTSL